MALSVEMLHRKQEIVVFSDGSSAPITNWVDAWGDDCGPNDHPVSAVAGPDSNGQWHSVDLSEFDPVEVN